MYLDNTSYDIQIFRGGVFHGSLSFARSEYSSNVLENMPLNSVILTVITNRYLFRYVIGTIIIIFVVVIVIITTKGKATSVFITT